MGSEAAGQPESLDGPGLVFIDHRGLGVRVAVPWPLKGPR